jgi:hypothetical protein
LYQIQLDEFMTRLRKIFHYYATSVGSLSTLSDVSDSTQTFMGNKNHELDSLYDDLGSADHNSNE